jgi:uncharacterized protein (TIGR00297 family)
VNLALGAAVNAALALGALSLRGVDRSGAIAGAVAGTALLASSGWRGYVLLILLFILATATTRIGHARKSAMGIAEARGGRRGAGKVLANISAGVVFALLAHATAYTAACTTAMAAAFATAACDTVSSEIGKPFGRRHRSVLTFRRVAPGTAGAVTAVGTLSGLAAAALMAAAAWGAGLVGGPGVAIVTAAAFVAAAIESFLRAASVGNECANLANTLAGGVLAMAMHVLWLGA